MKNLGLSVKKFYDLLFDHKNLCGYEIVVTFASLIALLFFIVAQVRIQ